ncbi:hypothetical protein Poly59_12630 [Rubripirellula reticaptiva]|uniref:Uncharacterized protein n=1 Tax=Rubripirellula reticaptiva TaxID=2528013 RepID=A0A5C6FC35_9BACT|nr:hypothetical protein Poly59_12630 [Rubripirellula reticaptiva]
MKWKRPSLEARFVIFSRQTAPSDGIFNTEPAERFGDFVTIIRLMVWH